MEPSNRDFIRPMESVPPKADVIKDQSRIKNNDLDNRIKSHGAEKLAMLSKIYDKLSPEQQKTLDKKIDKFVNKLANEITDNKVKVSFDDIKGSSSESNEIKKEFKK